MYILFNKDNYKDINEDNTDRVRVMLKNRADMLGSLRAAITAVPSTLALLTEIVTECDSTLHSFEVVKGLEDTDYESVVFKVSKDSAEHYIEVVCKETVALLVKYVTQQLQMVDELNKELEYV